MIYLDKEVMDLENSVFMENNFIKHNKNYFFITDIQYCFEDESINIYLAIKLISNKFTNRLKLKNVIIYTKNIGENEEIIKEKKLEDGFEEDLSIMNFFHYLSYEDDEEKIKIHENILLFLADYFKRNFDNFYAYTGYYKGSNHKKALYIEFLDLFLFRGKVNEGYYEGNLILDNIELMNKSTGQIIETNFKSVNLAENFYIKEGDNADYMIEGYLESMSEEDIKDKFKESINKALNCF